MNTELASLDDLGLMYGTDKASRGHGYLATYERFLSPLRFRPLQILEIGVKEGASVRMWRDYFVNARVIGFDIVPAVQRFAEPRIAIEIGDQSSSDDLAALCSKHGPFDLIVEDGSHYWGHQIFSLEKLFPELKPGGIYIMEDIQTSFSPLAERYSRGSDVSAVEYLKRVADIVAAASARPADVPPDMLAVAREVGFLLFTKHAAIIEKRRRG
ncbi:class I SAM-dependent methyltransferase [Roseomonas sp. HF4]|uniref:class I SAM-dependent methyltransferase n=1 Tax=Roseomonas sp. HF4 TaxID=2562313 RepID=UPI0010C12336|nr:class I SAM-dependent methyltransferase [Roseomonas sp. HF4]